MEQKKEAKTHVFLKPCGCMETLIVDRPHNYGELAKAFRYAEKHGLIYKLMETQEVREMPWQCEAHKENK